jgi:hypothetical protein
MITPERDDPHALRDALAKRDIIILQVSGGTPFLDELFKINRTCPGVKLLYRWLWDNEDFKKLKSK